MTETTVIQFTKSLLEHVSEISDPSIPQVHQRDRKKKNKILNLRERKEKLGIINGLCGRTTPTPPKAEPAKGQRTDL